MRFQRILGEPCLVVCSGCQEERTAGSPDRRSASGRLLDVVYQDIDSGGLYCEPCAARHAEGIDSTRSVKMFYADTHGEVIA